MFSFSGAEVAQLIAASRRTHHRLRLRDQAGTWQTIGGSEAAGPFLGGVNWLDEVRISAQLDSVTMSFTATLRLASGAQTISPLVESAPLNQHGGQYDPLVAVGSEVAVEVAVSAAGGTPATWHSIFHGRLDSVAPAGRDTLMVAARDLGGRLADAELLARLDIGASSVLPSTPLESAIQSVVDAALGAGQVTVVGSTGILIRRAIIEPGNAFERARALALEHGHDLRYRRSGSSWQLTVYEPARTLSTPHWTLGPSHYHDVTQLTISGDRIRNRVRAYYNGASGDYWEGEDSASIARFGPRDLVIGGHAASTLETVAAAQAAVTAALSDLSSPDVAQRIECSFFPPVELGDLGRWLANGVHYDLDHDWAVSAYEHVLAAQSRRTYISVAGAPAAGRRSWLDLGQLTDFEFFVSSPIENLLPGLPGFDPATVYDETDEFSVPIDAIRPMIEGVSSNAFVSGSVAIRPTGSAGTWRMQLRQLDANGVQLGSVATGDLAAGASPQEITSKLRSFPIDVANAAELRIGIVRVSGSAAAQWSKPVLNRGHVVSLYEDVVARTFDLANFRPTTRTPTLQRYEWVPGSAIKSIEVYYNTGVSPAYGGTLQETLAPPGGMDLVDVPLPPPDQFGWLELRPRDWKGQYAPFVRAQLHPDPTTPADQATVSANLELRVIAGNPKSVDLYLAIDASDSAAYPIDWEIRANSKSGTILGSGTAPGAMNLQQVATGIAYTVETFWLKITTSTGVVEWSMRQKRVITADLVEIGTLSQIADDMGIVVHGALINQGGTAGLNLDATGSQLVLWAPGLSITAAGAATFSGEVSAWKFSGTEALFANGFTGFWKHRYNRVSDPAGSPPLHGIGRMFMTGETEMVLGSPTVGSFLWYPRGQGDGAGFIFMQKATGSPVSSLTVDEVIVNRINGQLVSFGANDSGGSGFRVVRVPN